MTNEQLVLLIREGHLEYIPQLWKQVEKFVAWKARRMFSLRGGVGGATVDDFFQSGFLALMGAIKYFDESRAASFLTALDYFLKREFDDAAGIHHGRKNPFDVIDSSLSLDAPIGAEEDVTLVETLPDKSADMVFSAVEDHEAWMQKKKAVSEAIASLSDQQKEVLHYIYWQQLTRADIAVETGLSEKDVEKISHDAIRKLRHPRVSRELRQYVGV